ncbi:MFS transporter [Microbulbifer aggregans]|uniref:MFS transporter n=1 Tax=Microbulbifer aggregans TaxID=1769779 RepID=UPI001CFE5F94|nr:MFS transporter [Microbulbifer aggregans]
MPKSFVIFWISTAVASIGSFFTLVAIPWLTLELTDSALALSSVMACISLPHSVFILFGGTLSDIYRPIRVLLFSRILFLLTLSCLCALIFSGLLVFWHLYPIALLLGCSGSLAVTSAQSIPPFLVPESKLQVCNGILMGTNQASQVVGPVLAAWLIYFAQKNWSHGAENAVALSVGFALLVDLAGIVLSIALIVTLRFEARGGEQSDNFLKSFKRGLSWCVKDRAMCIVLCYIALASLLIHGPLAVVLPLIAKAKFSSSVTDFGQLYSCLGVGALIGSLIAIKVKIPAHLLSIAVIVGDLVSGSMLFGVAHVQTLIGASFYILFIGLSLGVISVSGITWFQKRTPSEYMGRIMSLLLFAVFGLTPLSAALSGMFIEAYSTQYLLQWSGMLLIVVALAGLCIPGFRRVGALPAQTI